MKFKYWILIEIILCLIAYAITYAFVFHTKEAQEILFCGLMLVSILVSCIVVPHILARLIYSKDKHHSGMDIKQQEK